MKAQQTKAEEMAQAEKDAILAAEEKAKAMKNVFIDPYPLIKFLQPSRRMQKRLVQLDDSDFYETAELTVMALTRANRPMVVEAVPLVLESPATKALHPNAPVYQCELEIDRSGSLSVPVPLPIPFATATIDATARTDYTDGTDVSTAPPTPATGSRAQTPGTGRSGGAVDLDADARSIIGGSMAGMTVQMPVRNQIGYEERERRRRFHRSVQREKMMMSFIS
jgi:hypothetical protein